MYSLLVPTQLTHVFSYTERIRSLSFTENFGKVGKKRHSSNKTKEFHTAVNREVFTGLRKKLYRNLGKTENWLTS